MPYRVLSSRTLENRHKRAGYRSTRPVKRQILKPRHKAYDDNSVELVINGILHLGDESIGPKKTDFYWMKRMVSGCVRYAQRNIVETVPSGGASVIV